MKITGCSNRTTAFSGTRKCSPGSTAGPGSRAVGRRQLAVFDVDGTLTDSCQLDSDCYIAALADCFGLPGDLAGYDWNNFTDITDSGLVAELLAEREGRVLEDAELATFERIFVGHLQSALAANPERCQPISGALDLVRHLSADSGWEIAFATGGFRASALLKLSSAGFERPQLLRSANDARARRAIVESAIAAATRAAGCRFQTVVLFDDALWDASVASQLGLPLIAIATEDNRAALTAAGAVEVIPDFRDLPVLLATLEAMLATPMRLQPYPASVSLLEEQPSG